MTKYLLALVLLMLSTVAQATVWFNPAPNTIVDSPIVDPNAQTEVNGNFSQLVSDGNTGLASILASLAGIGPVGVPSGAVIMWSAGTSCPTGYQVADGTNGTADARGVYIRGLDTGGSIDPGRTLASFQGDTFQTHTHGASPAVPVSTNNSSNSPAGGSSVVSGLNTSVPNTLGMSGGVGGTETRPVTTVLLFCEKL